MTGLESRVLLHWQRKGMKQTEDAELRAKGRKKKWTKSHKGSFRKVRVARTHRDELHLLGNVIFRESRDSDSGKSSIKTIGLGTVGM